MAAAMIVLAIGCAALGLLVVPGLSSPVLVGAATDALLAGVFAM